MSTAMSVHTVGAMARNTNCTVSICTKEPDTCVYYHFVFTSLVNTNLCRNKNTGYKQNN